VRLLLERLGLLAAAPRDNTYHAFISYSHAVDGKLAPALQRGLQRFAKPWYRARALRIFRDQTSLSANPHLWGSIAAALDASQHFILLASPEAARSPWVAREVEYWCERKPADDILIALTDGELLWDPSQHDFDRERTTALPSPLHGMFTEEPRWIDFRFARTTDDLSLHHAAFRDAVADLGAPLHGVPKDTLAGEEVRQHRRTLRIARSAAAILLALTAAAVLLAVFALDQRDQALSQSRRATSRAVAVEAVDEFSSNPERALLLAMEAYRLSPTAEARSALVHGLVQSQGVAGFLRPTARAIDLAISADGKTLASLGVSSQLQMWDLAGGRELGAPAPLRPEVSEGGVSIALAGNGQTLATSGGARVKLWRVQGRRALRSTFKPREVVFSLALSPDGKTVAVTSVTGPRGVRLYDAGTGDPVSPLLHRGFVFNMHCAEEPVLCPTPVAFSRDGGTFAWVGYDKRVRVWSVARKRQVGGPIGMSIRAVALSPDGTRLASAGADGAVRLWQIDRGRQLHLYRRPAAVDAVAFTAAGEVVTAVSADGTVRLWRTDAQRELGRPLTLGSFPSADAVLALSADGSGLAAADAFGNIRRWNVGWRPDFGGTPPRGSHLHLLGEVTEKGRSVFRNLLLKKSGGCVAFSPDLEIAASVSPGEGTIQLWRLRERRKLGAALFHADACEVAFSPDGKTLASGSGDGTVRLWDVQTGRELGGVLSQSAVSPPSGQVDSLAFTTSGDALLVSLFDGSERLWRPLPLQDAGVERLETGLCSIVRGNLTRSDWRVFFPGEGYHRTCPAFPAPAG
jgi:WD40 repeat protein